VLLVDPLLEFRGGWAGCSSLGGADDWQESGRAGWMRTSLVGSSGEAIRLDAFAVERGSQAAARARARQILGSNCVRPPHPKGWGMLRVARPVFWEFRTRRVFVAQIPLICTICFIDLEEQKEHARVHFIPDLKVGVFVTLRAPDVINE